MTTIQDIELTKIRPSKTNPRKTFDVEGLNGLADSIRQKGILQPLTVRPDWCIGKTDEDISKLNGDAERADAAFFEIVAGERRYRASSIAKLDKVPVIVRHLGDQDTLELQLIENLQRDDLDPFEEAEGYQRLLNLKNAAGNAVHTIQSIAKRVGKDRSRIYYRLRLLRVSEALRKAVRGGEVSVESAEAVGFLPTQDMRDSAAAEVLKPTNPEYGVGPLTVRQTREMIADRFRRSLAAAPFDVKDAALVPVTTDDATGERVAGGDCDSCPMRTGNMEALIGKTKRPDVCTNPRCFVMKCDAHFSRLQKTAEAEGKKLLSEKESAELFDEDGRLWFDSPYVLLAQQPDRAEVNPDVKRIPSWKFLLESVENKPQIVIARDPKGRIVEMVDRQLAIEAAKLAAKGKNELSIFDLKKPRSTADGSTSTTAASAGAPEDAWRKQERKKREAAKVNLQFILGAMTALTDAIDKKGIVPGFWDALIAACITHAGHDGCWMVCKLHGLDPKKGKRVDGVAGEGVEGAALEFGTTLPDEKLKLGFVIELLLSQRVKFSSSMGGLRSVEVFKRFAKLYKIELAEIEKNVRSEAKKPKRIEQAKMFWLRKPEGDFRYNSNGVCEKPAVLVLTFPKTTKIKMHLEVARLKKGWASGYDMESGKNGSGGSGLPARSGQVFPTVREALIYEAEQGAKYLKTDKVAPTALALMQQYVADIREKIVIDEGRGIEIGSSSPAKPSTAKHVWEKITDTKFRCKGCGASAVKHDGKFIEEKSVRGKPCSLSEKNPKKSKPAKAKAKKGGGSK